MESKATERSPPGSWGYESCQSWGRKSQLTALPLQLLCMPASAQSEPGHLDSHCWRGLAQGYGGHSATHLCGAISRSAKVPVNSTNLWMSSHCWTYSELSTVLGTGGWLVPSVSSQPEMSTPPALTWTDTHQNYSYSLGYPVRPEVGFSRGWTISPCQYIASIVYRASFCSLSYLVLRLIL